MILRFHHGWGLDASLWNGVVALLPDFDAECLDRGYFGVPRDPSGDGAALIVTHSFGTLTALADMPPGCRGLVTINGFDRFTAAGDVPGVNRRIVDRMIARFAEDPAAVLADFRKRCGGEDALGELHLDRLRADLEALRDRDCRAEAARLRVPILSLQGADDPILPPAMRGAVFAGAWAVERLTHPQAGHLLPITHPEFCAARIRAFARGLA